MQLFQSKDGGNDVMKVKEKSSFVLQNRLGPGLTHCVTMEKNVFRPFLDLHLKSTPRLISNFLRSLRWLTFALVTAVTWEKRLQIMDQHGWY